MSYPCPWRLKFGRDVHLMLGQVIGRYFTLGQVICSMRGVRKSRSLNLMELTQVQRMLHGALCGLAPRPFHCTNPISFVHEIPYDSTEIQGCLFSLQHYCLVRLPFASLTTARSTLTVCRSGDHRSLAVALRSAAIDVHNCQWHRASNLSCSPAWEPQGAACVMATVTTSPIRGALISSCSMSAGMAMVNRCCN